MLPGLEILPRLTEAVEPLTKTELALACDEASSVEFRTVAEPPEIVRAPRLGDGAEIVARSVERTPPVRFSPLVNEPP